MGPIDYSGAFGGQNPAQAFAQSFGLGAGIQQQRMAMEQQQLAQIEAQRKAAAQEAMQAELATLSANPTPQAIAQMSIKYPQLSEGFKRSYDMLAPEQKQARLSATVPVYAAALNGQPAVAADLLDRQAESLKNSGREQEAEQIRAFATLFRDQPESAKETAGLLLSAVMGPDKFVETFGQLGQEQRAAELQPLTVREAVAKTTTAEVTAANAPQLARIEVAQKGAAAKIEQFKAREEELRAAYAPQRVKIEVEKLGADLGLTRAQIGQAAAAAAASRASAAASSASAQAARATAERERIGLLPPDKRAEAEAKLRAEYSKETKVFQDVRESYRRVNVSEDNAVGDLALIFGFMKMLDPGSVVREGEFATAQNAAGVPERVQSLYNRALRGERLTASQRAAFKGQAKQVFGAAQQQEQTVRAGLSRVATGYGLDTKNIFFEDAATPTPAPTPTPTPAAKPPTKAEIDAALNKYLPKKP
jgi:hypothetical protein